jgi:hypothetical protein
MTVQTNPPHSTTPRSNTARIFLSLAIVLVCLALGSGFIWWYLKGGDSDTIKLSAADMAAMQDAARQMAYRDNGGVPMTGRGRGPLGSPNFVAPPPPPDPDTVTVMLGIQVIRAGQALASIRPGPKVGDPAIVTFKQKSFGELIDPPSFTIARRIVHEDSLARQLAVGDDQLKQLAVIVASPAVSSKYLAALPVDPTKLDNIRSASAAYTKAMASTDKGAQEKAQSALIDLVRQFGNAAMSTARQEYDDADRNISAILTPRQIEAYKQGKTIASR